MKYFLIMFLGFLSFNQAWAQNGPFKCEMDSYGYVRIVFEHKIDDSRKQVMEYRVGQEQDFNNPYDVRELCEGIIVEIREFSREGWSYNRCDYRDDIIINHKIFGFKITEMGSKLLDDTRGISSDGVIWFEPDNQTLVDKDFVRYVRTPTDIRECGGF